MKVLGEVIIVVVIDYCERCSIMKKYKKWF